MTAEQKRVAAWIAIGFLITGVVSMGWLTYLAGSANFVDNPSGDAPSLHLSWKLALWFIELGTSANAIFATLITAITAGVAVAADSYKSSIQIALIAALSIAGIVLGILLMVFIGDDSNGEILRYFSKYEALQELESATNAFVKSVIGWFSLFLVSQLGISAFKQGGAVRNLAARLFG